MSLLRGLFPLVLATAFGVFNGIIVFRPAFRDQQKQKLEEQQHDSDPVPPPNPAEKQALKEAEVEANAGGATTSVSKIPPPEPDSWSVLRFWERKESKKENTPNVIKDSHISVIAGNKPS